MALTLKKRDNYKIVSHPDGTVRAQGIHFYNEFEIIIKNPATFKDYRYIYDTCLTKSHGIYCAYESNGIPDDKRGLINKDGEEVLPCIYTDLRVIDERFIIVRDSNRQFKVVNLKGQIVSPRTYYSDIYHARDGLFQFHHKSMSGDVAELMDRNFKVMVRAVSGSIYCENNSVMVKTYSINQNGQAIPQARLHDYTGKILVEEGKYDTMHRLHIRRSRHKSKEFYLVAKGDLHGLIDHEGKEIVPCIYDNVRYINAKRFAGYKHTNTKEIAVYTNTGKNIITDGRYYDVYPFKYGMAVVVSSNRKYGYITTSGREAIPCRYDYASNFRDDGEAAVSLNNRSGYIDKRGKIVSGDIPAETSISRIAAKLRAKKNG